ncbi:hypothetical protein ASB62_00880 [Chlorobium limicola]|uniref:Uncharacterized protein n=1 Tax=Chlorobium limicola TaxID=1092 RepID=A0A117MS89_CHLLI|nr:hypothetical protein ASB62_00880 [Chlorobium limicola]
MVRNEAEVIRQPTVALMALVFLEKVNRGCYSGILQGCFMFDTRSLCEKLFAFSLLLVRDNVRVEST